MPIDIVIAARNEQATIYETLAALAAQVCPEPFRVIVSTNGCTDRTADEVRRAAAELANARCTIELVDRPDPGKTGALNAAEQRIDRVGVRIYLDADIQLSKNAIAALAAAVAGPEARIAAPRKTLRKGKSWLVDFCSRCWLALPWVQDDVLGGGALAVNPEGRARWQEFPKIVADDTFAALQFAPHERTVVRECTTAIRFPNSVKDMLRAQRRWVDGGRQLDASAFKPPYGPAWSSKRRLVAMLHPKVFAAAMVVRCQRIAARLFTKPPQAASWSTPR